MSRRGPCRKVVPLYRNPELMSDEQKADDLKAYWDKIVVPAFGRKGWEAPSQARLRFDPEAHDSCRHFGGIYKDGRTIVVAPVLADTPDNTAIAILAHEAGHATDLANPGRFWLRTLQWAKAHDNGLLRILTPITPRDDKLIVWYQELPTKGFDRHLKLWESRGREEEENLADALAEYAMDTRIGYTGTDTCLVETLGRGVPRPRGLR